MANAGDEKLHVAAGVHLHKRICVGFAAPLWKINGKDKNTVIICLLDNDWLCWFVKDHHSLMLSCLSCFEIEQRLSAGSSLMCTR